MRVLKFGGSSVADGTRIRSVMDIVKAAAETQSSACTAVVFSAAAGVTDVLLAAAHNAAKGNDCFRIDLETLSERHFEIVRGIIPVNKQSSVIAEVKALHTE